MTTDNRPEGPPENRRGPFGRLQRSRGDRLIGGVCAGIAHQLDVDPVLVRIGAVLLGLVSAGTAVLAYVLAWVLIPQESDARHRPVAPPVPPQPPRVAAHDGPRVAWKAVGEDLRALATDLRPAGGGPAAPATPAATPTGTSAEGPRSPLEKADAAVTAFGDRLRTPEVRADANRAAASLSAAIGATVDQVGRRGRTEAPGPAPAPEDRGGQPAP